MKAAADPIRLGTRGSLLAQAQSRLIRAALLSIQSDLQVELVTIKTSGDQLSDRRLHVYGGKGLFTRELEEALLSGTIDFAVHSFKDVPVTMPLVDQSRLIFAAVPKREDARDVLVSLSTMSIESLPDRARVGTSSLRRTAQLLSMRPDVQVLPIRGNIDTRLRKLHDGQFDAIILAMAGLKRSGLLDDATMSPIDLDQMLPAAGQGALVLQCRRDDRETMSLLAQLNDADTFDCVAAERWVVEQLRGDCHSPIAVHAMIEPEGTGVRSVRIRAAVAAREGKPPVIRVSLRSEPGELRTLAARAAEQLVGQGARELLAGLGGRSP